MRCAPSRGRPVHRTLLRLGYRIAICEQLEDPKLTKTIVRREVTRVLTPGTAIDPALNSEQNNFLAALCFDGSKIGLALLDNSTGDFRATEFRGRDGQEACESGQRRTGAVQSRRKFCWLKTGGGISASLEDALRSRTVTHLEPWVLTRDYAVPLLENHLGTRELAGFGLEGHATAAVAAGSIVHYLARHAIGPVGAHRPGALLRA